MSTTDWQAVLKRTFDITVAAVALMLAAPLLLLIAALIVLESPGPVTYRAERVGFRHSRLRMLKFRKMRVDAAGPALTVNGDPRLTRIGAVLVRTRLDELPQLWHVLRGDMSLVGPRPEDPIFVARFTTEYDEILRVRPGLTGWTQLAFADERRILSPDDPLTQYLEAILPQKVQLDRLYASPASMRRDMRILAGTVQTVLLGQPIAVNRRTGAMNVRRRPRPTSAPIPVSADLGDPQVAVVESSGRPSVFP